MTRTEDVDPYVMRISRMTVDKLGVRLYDRVSAVVAELVANAYDADAETVTVRLPLATLLARQDRCTGEIEGRGYVIEVEDDGHGIEPEEANPHFLTVGNDRRKDPSRGGESRGKSRRVMGRKGIGKLAPFGICKQIEVVSAGGERTARGYRVAHFVMDYDKIVVDHTEPVELDAGEFDRTYRATSGTTIRLLHFLPKRVPDRDTFHRQLARRFGIRQEDFRIRVEDERNPAANPPFDVGDFEVPTMESSRVDVSVVPVTLEDGTELPVSGWMGLAKEAYKNEEMAGVRIYARSKIVATTRDFEQPAGFTGEFTLRSYLVGAVDADWLDDDEGEDLITTDRQDILWESDYGRALRRWGAEWIQKIGTASRGPRRKRVEQLFLEAADLEAKAISRFGDPDIVATAVELGKQIGRFAAEDELSDQEYVEGLAGVVLSVAPHKALMDAFEAFNREVFGEEYGLEHLVDLFSKTRIAEMASYSQIANERVTAIKRLEQVIDEGAEESVLQRIIAQAPWLIEATWAPITVNQGLKRFAKRFKTYYYREHGTDLAIAIDHERKRPDFTLISVTGRLHVVEIKAVGGEFGNKDWDRLRNYLEAFHGFFGKNPELTEEFYQEWVVDLVCDTVAITDRDKRDGYDLWKETRGRIRRVSWVDFLARAQKANETFLEAHERVQEEAARLAGTK